MIQSFKKGSYKFSMMAVILVLLIGTATLTNANASEAGASAWVHAEDGGTLFPNEKFRVYDNLEKGAKVAPFTFKVPSLLPKGYGFSNLSIKFNASPPSVNLGYVMTKISKRNGNFSLEIKPGTDLQKQYDQNGKGSRKDIIISGRIKASICPGILPPAVSMFPVK